MLFSDFIKLPDKEKVLLFEGKVAKPKLQDESWTATGGGSYWIPFTDGEVVAVTELLISSGAVTDYTEVASIATCDSTTSSFYFDFTNQRLYVHTSADDSPETAGKYDISAYFWVCITNEQDESNLVIYTPQDASNKVYYLPYLDPTHTHSLLQQVKDFYTGIVPWQRCSIKFLNDGWFYKKFKSWIWHNKEMELKVGQRGSTYNDFEVIVKGKMRDPGASDQEALINVRDHRAGELRQLPINKYWTSNYPNLEEGAEGRVIQILFGKALGIVPIRVDTLLFKVCDYPMEAIDAVYKAGELLTVTTDYTLNGDNNEITLVNDPGDAEITCDARGVKCGAGSTYSENVADILDFVFTTLNSLPSARLDSTAFTNLRDNRTQKLSWYIKESISTWNLIRLLQQTSLFQVIPLPNGTYTVKFYETGVPAGTPDLTDEDYDFLGIFYDTSQIYHRAVIKYNCHPGTGKFESVEYSDAKVPFRYDDKQTLTIISALRLQAEADSLADMYSQMACLTLKRVKGIVSSQLIRTLPIGKSTFSKKIVDGEGQEVTVLDAEVYRILELKKDFKTMKVVIMGVKDEVGSVHANIAHSNTPHLNSHTDTIHENEHTDLHDNVPHEDSGQYADVPHSDAHDNTHNDYDDVPHINLHQDEHWNALHEDQYEHGDSYTDTHGNMPHDNVPHSDGGQYADVHYNTAHENHQDEFHENEPYVDYHEDEYEHGDTHGNALHENIPHEDAHTDTGVHGNSYSDYYDDPIHNNLYTDYYDHADTHTDAHENVPHDNQHTDVTHENVPHDNVAHENVPHTDGGYHVNVPHSNMIDPHENIAHEDYYTHADSHGNVAHQNVPHEDAHTDTGVHGNSHADHQETV